VIAHRGTAEVPIALGVPFPGESDCTSGRARTRTARVRARVRLCNKLAAAINNLSTNKFSTSMYHSILQSSTKSPSSQQVRATDSIKESVRSYMSRAADYPQQHGQTPSIERNTRASNVQLLALLPPEYGAPSVVTPIIASQVALPDDLRTLPLLDHLPPDIAARYANPDNILKPVADRPSFAANPSFGGSRAEYVLLIKRMMAANMVSFTTTPEVVNGIFGVFKKDGMIRLIINATPANDTMVPSEKVQLPSPTLFASLEIPEGKELYVSKTDIDNMYHRLRLPAWMVPYFALPAVSAKELGLTEFGDQDVYPCCLTLPMGSSHSTFLAQAAHQHFIDKHVPLMKPADRLSPATDVFVQRPRHGQYIDDCFWLDTSEGGAEASLAMKQYLAACDRVGWVAKISKTVWPSSAGVEVLGIHVDGVTGLVGLRADRLRLLADVTEAVVRSGSCTGDRMRHLVGRWTWAVLVRRPALSALSAVYKFCASAGSRSFQIWPSVRRELWTLIGLAPVLVAKIQKRKWFPYIIAVDASSSGGGVVGAHIEPSAIAKLASRPANLPAVSPTVATKGPIAGVPLVDSSKWRVVASYKWRRPRHINLLELSALTTSVRWVLSYKDRAVSDCLILSDSAVVVGAVRKGRSSSFEILRALRRLTALVLSSSLNICLWWVPTDHNPADEPSRRFA
jgi:hypothetical protein